MTMDTRYLSVKEIGKRYGISRIMLQRYERIGLIHHTGHNKYGHLYYDKEMEGRILYIRHLQLCKFTLPEIRDLFNLSMEEMESRLEEKVKELNLNAEYLSKLALRTNRIIEAMETKDMTEIIDIIKEDFNRDYEEDC